MITILHGDHIEASRTELQKIKRDNANVEIREIQGKLLDPGLLTQALSSSSLFDVHTLVVIEGLMASTNKKSKMFDQYVQIITAASPTSEIVLWESKEMTPATLKLFGPGCSVRLFKLPVLMFQFLDAIRPGNAVMLLEILENLLSGEPAELVYTMMITRIRQLIQIKDHVAPTNTKDWQQTRLTTQANSFSMEKLTDIYAVLLEREYSIKSGNTPFSMREHIEQVIVQL